jgi:hypothetical protein
MLALSIKLARYLYVAIVPVESLGNDTQKFCEMYVWTYETLAIFARDCPYTRLPIASKKIKETKALINCPLWWDMPKTAEKGGWRLETINPK